MFQLLSLMRKLAAFESYLERFAVTEVDLLERGFSSHRHAEFAAWVAEHDGQLCGYAVVYVTPFTFDLRPTLVLKELYVDAEFRGSGSGRALLEAVVPEESIPHGKAGCAN